jgi:hypothetical protein
VKVVAGGEEKARVIALPSCEGVEGEQVCIQSWRYGNYLFLSAL